MVTICAKCYNSGVAGIEHLPVLVIRIGVEGGLSAPILFDGIIKESRKTVLLGSNGKVSAVETILQSAVDFLLGLEQHEIAASGLRPDPIKSTRNVENGFLGQWGEGLLREA